MASRTIASPNVNQQGVELTNPTIPGFSYGGGGGGGFTEGGQFSGIDNPEALQLLLKTLGELQGGGTPEMIRQQGERNTQIKSARGTLSDYTKNKAFQDSADLMAQNLRQAMEKNMPAISKAIQGAGTSQSSMQGLLATKLATESSQAAGALGANQALGYGQISAALQGVLEKLTAVDRSSIDSLLKGLELFKTSKEAHSSYQAPQNPQISVGASGGGSYFQPVSGGSPTQVTQAPQPTQPTGYWADYVGTQYQQTQQPAGTDFNGAPLSGGAGLSDDAYLAMLSGQSQNRPVDEPTWGYGD